MKEKAPRPNKALPAAAREFPTNWRRSMRAPKSRCNMSATFETRFLDPLRSRLWGIISFKGKIEIYFTPAVNYTSVSAIEVIPE
jgi:hypothetical protein